METQDNFAPYAPTENVLRVLTKLRASGIRGPVNSEFLIQLGINESMAPRTIRTLEFLDLTAPDGSPTPLLEQYVVASDEDAQSLLRDTIQKAYAMILRAVDPAVDPRQKIFNAFRTMRPQGQWDRMTTLFLGLCRSAGMEVKDAPPNRSARSEGSRDRPQRTNVRPKREQRTAEATPPSAVPQHATSAPTRSALDPAIQSFLDKVRDLNTVAELEEWFGAFRTVFTYVKARGDEPTA